MRYPLMLLTVLFVSLSGQALAYVGPGTGLSAIGAFIALVLALLVGILGFVWYPVKKLFRRKSDGLALQRDES